MANDGLFYGNTDQLMKEDFKLQDAKRSCSVDEYYEIIATVNWLKSLGNDTRKVALQFPDELLSDSNAVSERLSLTLPTIEFFILADTSYGSCCVDSVAAQHYNAHALIHYGPSCLSPCTSLPVYWVFGKATISCPDCISKLSQVVVEDDTKQLVLMYSVEYLHCRDTLYSALKEKFSRLVLSKFITEGKNSSDTECVTSMLEVNGRQWQTRSPDSSYKDYDVIYIGGEGRTLTNLMIVMNSSRFFSYNPANCIARLESAQVNKSLMKRYYMVERAKDAMIVGIVVGTMGVNSYLQEHDRLRDMIKKSGKKPYSFVVGKLNPAKLGNFMEIDVFVLISCSENSLIDSSEFFKPVVTPYEMEVACNRDRQWTGEYITDFTSLLPGGNHYQPLAEDNASSADLDVSLISGRMRRIGVSCDTDTEVNEGSNGALVIREKNMSLMPASSAHTAGEYLSGRSWVGLEQDLGQTPVQKAKIGQTGIASHYQGEPS